MKVFVVGGDTAYTSFLKDSTVTNDLQDADVVLFTGGEDVNPSLYGKPKLECTFSNLRRDLYEKSIFEQIKPYQVPVGICRGSQFLCVMNGGLLVQDCSGHALNCTHSIVNEYGMVYEITSTHHQMQYPFNLNPEDYNILFAALPKLGRYYAGVDKEPSVEPEVVIYKKTDSIAIQGHPEMIPNSAVSKMLNNLIKDYVDRKRNNRC